MTVVCIGVEDEVRAMKEGCVPVKNKVGRGKVV